MVFVKHPFAHALFSKKAAPKISPLLPSHLLHGRAKSKRLDSVGCMILAGGQGTRLGWSGPKGCMPLPLPGAPTLFSHLLGQIARLGTHLPVAIMTSSLNCAKTKRYLRENHFFKLKNLSLFVQGTLPVCDEEGRFVYQNRRCFVTAPTGNGHALAHFYRSGLFGIWKRAGVHLVQVMLVDNFLGCPFDLELLGLHQACQKDLVLRIMRRESPTEKVGRVGIFGNRLVIEEYHKSATFAESISAYPFGNTGIFSCTMEWIERVASQALPWHVVQKARRGEVWGKRGWNLVTKVVQFESFIFDLFPYATSFACLPSERARFFAPIKTAEDLHKIANLQKLL